VRLVTDGFSTREIAKQCNLSQQTVKHHLTRILAKLGVGDRRSHTLRWTIWRSRWEELLDYLADLVERIRRRHR
jgi:orotate phosphoribosyltransferase-like protein